MLLRTSALVFVLVLVLASIVALAEDDALGGGAPIKGRVLDRSGDPVPKASFRLVPLAKEEPADWSRRVDTLWRSVRSDDAGRFELKHVPPGSYRLHATVTTWFDPIVVAVDEVEPGGDEVELRFPVDLPPLPVRITVVVTTPDGNPVQGGWFAFTGFPQPRDFKHFLKDGRGSAVIARYPPPGWKIPRVEVLDCKDESGRPLAAHSVSGVDFETQTLEVRLKGSRSLEGCITIGGRPVKTRLHIQGTGPHRSFWKEVNTRSDGTYRVEGLPAGPLKVNFAAGYRSSRIEPIADVPAGQTRFDHDVREYVPIRGRVVAPPGIEVTGLRSDIWQRADWGGINHRNGYDSKGTLFEFGRVNAGERYELLLRADTRGEEKLVARGVEVVPGGEPLLVAFEVGATIHGVVVDEQEKPHARVEVGAYTIPGQRWDDHLEGWHSHHTPRATTDDEGRFTLRGVPHGTVLLRGATGPFPSESPWTTGWQHHDTASEEPVRLVIREVEPIAGRVQAPEGVVFHEGWAIDAYAADEPALSASIASGRVGTDGSFELAGAIVGPVRLEAAARWRGRTDLYAIGGPFPAGTKDIRLEVAEGAQIGGLVVDADGEPIESVDVRVESRQWRRAVGTDAKGRWLVRALPPGPYRVEARHWRTHSEVLEDVKPGTLDLRLVIR